MSPRCLKTGTALLVGLSVVLPLGCDGSDGAQGPVGPQGPPGPPGSGGGINATTAPFEQLEQLDLVSTITDVTIASPPVVTFTLTTTDGVPIVGLVPYWEASNRFVRFTITKLVPGMNGDPDSWVAYVRDATSGEPDYDTGASLVDNEDGSYVFTFNTDVANVPGVAYEPTLTHRVAGQIGQFSTVPLEEQNLWLDFVPDGSMVTNTRNIAVMTSCNECHDNLVFHGRRFEVQYCVQCHNPDLATGGTSWGEGNFSFMIHRIHNAGDFTVLDGGVSFAEVTYPQDLANCRKCHNADDPETPEADNWQNLPNMWACAGCHDNFGPNATNMHTGGPQTSNMACTLCHPSEVIREYHTTPNATPNNPELLVNQRNITYELNDASVDGTNNVTINFRVLSDGTPLDVTNLPADLRDGMGVVFQFPSFLLAWAEQQDGITNPADYNNMGQRGAQPLSVSLGNLAPIQMAAPIGMLSYDMGTGVNTATITDAASQFPVGSTLRAVGLQGYFTQDLDGDGSSDVSLHTPSVVVAVTGDSARRSVVDTANCSRCHEWFEGHGGNRVFGFGSDLICTMCHNPNVSSSGRTVVDPTARGLDVDIQAAITAGTLDPSVDPNNPRTYPEDAQNFKDMIHGIHSAGFRDRHFQHVRGPGRQGYYDWSEITFPRGASTSNCTLCHMEGTYELPLTADLLPTTVRTTGTVNGQDPDLMTAENAFVNVPNTADWVNSPTASACFYCHTSEPAWAHMSQNGGQLSVPPFGMVGPWVNRSDFIGSSFEACAVCHGPGKIADLEVVHDR